MYLNLFEYCCFFEGSCYLVKKFFFGLINDSLMRVLLKRFWVWGWWGFFLEDDKL